MAKEALDTNTKDAVASEIALTTETKATLYVKSKSGDHKNHRIAFEISPNGTDWFVSDISILGLGFISMSFVASKIRSKVIESEGSTSGVETIILAR